MEVVVFAVQEYMRYRMHNHWPIFISVGFVLTLLGYGICWGPRGAKEY